ncbi:DUF6283 family protein (plasmid) [Stutzerimonas frequens]|uniref:DUF6283 family protein n=1 Tax=Stutzerimonas frequens TaxID=2968969 RepID=UPI002DB825DB|nr:DUF6283 family protein [Stutzerimonas frequens]WRW29304.1 DUF6283 family protein [Stutzerimonas frequens]
MAKSKSEILDVRSAGADHQVVTIKSDAESKAGHLYRRKPCAKCPWRKDAVGEFPAEAFKHSASTAYDMSQRAFGCHDSGTSKPATCAGFLLRGADHNLRIRLAYVAGEIHDDLDDDGQELFDSYRDMAIANGVDPDDPVLKSCRD